MSYSPPVCRLKKSIPVANALGECILWDEQNEQVLWTDMPGRKLYSYTLRTDTIKHVSFDRDLCSFGMVVNSQVLLCAFDNGLALFDRTNDTLKLIPGLDQPDAIRLNDGRVDRQGRFWVGSLVDNPGNQISNTLNGQLYCIDANGDITTHLDGIRISNSICWSPTGELMYFADTPAKTIWQFDFNQTDGTLSNRRIFTTTKQNAGVPDGSTVDSEGCLWNAEWGSGRVVRYTPAGDINYVINLPVSQPTCVTFGGENYSDLYVSTARYGLDDSQLLEQPDAGDIFVYETTVKGLPEEQFINHFCCSL